MPAHDATPLHRALSHEGTRHVLMTLRVPLGLGVIVLLALNADERWLWPGLAVSTLGSLGQLWCFSCIHKARTLAVHGPYSLVRNPMYLARYFVIAGGLLVTGNLWLVAVSTLLYAVYAVTRVDREERRLRKSFGEPYEAYCRKVGRFFPRGRPLPGSQVLYANARWFRNNHGPLHAACVAGAYALLLFIAR